MSTCDPAFPEEGAAAQMQIDARIGDRRPPPGETLPIGVFLARPGLLVLSYGERAVALHLETPADARRLARGLNALATAMEEGARGAAEAASNALSRILSSRSNPAAFKREGF